MGNGTHPWRSGVCQIDGMFIGGHRSGEWGGVEPEGEFFLLNSSVTRLSPRFLPPYLCLFCQSIVRRPGDTQCSPPTPWAKRTLPYCSGIWVQTIGGGGGGWWGNTVDVGSWGRTGGDGLRAGLVMGLDIFPEGWGYTSEGLEANVC